MKGPWKSKQSITISSTHPFPPPPPDTRTLAGVKVGGSSSIARKAGGKGKKALAQSMSAVRSSVDGAFVCERTVAAVVNRTFFAGPPGAGLRSSHDASR